jgi:hypothetical protein
MPGVHASGQVIAFTYDGRLAAIDLERALRRAPPAGRCDPRRPPGSDRFHPATRRDTGNIATTVWNGPRSPLRERTALGVRVPLDTAAMARAGSVSRGPARL